MTFTTYVVVASIGILLVWQVFLVGLLNLPPVYNTVITAMLIGLAGLGAIAGISMMLLESVTLEQSAIRIRSGIGSTQTIPYEHVEAIMPVGDKVTIIFRDGSRRTFKNLRFGDGVSFGKINSLLSEARPELSIMNTPEQEAKASLR